MEPVIILYRGSQGEIVREYRADVAPQPLPPVIRGAQGEDIYTVVHNPNGEIQ
jgi:hypothetical protein